MPNNSFKPNLLRYTKAMAEKACHGFGSTTQVGLTQALGRMKLSSLANLLSSKFSASDFSAEIAGELAEHTRGLQKLGGNAPVQVTADTDLLLDRAGLGALCRLFASGQLTGGELAYAADVMQLSERVEVTGPEIASDLSECTDPEINGPLTVARALEIAGTGAAA